MTRSNGVKAVFLDRDGTLIYNRHYLKDPAGVEPIPGAIDGCLALQKAGFILIIITNQSGIGRGLLSESDFMDCEAQLERIFGDRGVYFSGHYFCPHHPKEARSDYLVACDCRKPAPGLILKATSHFSVDVSGSFMVGDNVSDVEAGTAAGCRSLLLSDSTEATSAVFQSSSFIEIAEHILELSS